MFFMIGITQGRKELPYNELVVCEHCGSYGRYQVFMTYMCLSLFFIPVLKWGKKYYVQTSCCNTIYALDSDLGKRISRGEESIDIQPSDLTKLQNGYRSKMKKCGQCGYETEDDFDYCPKCGNHL